MDDPKHLVDFRSPLLVQIVNSVGLGDLLAEGPRSVEEIGAATGWRPDLAARVLRALAPRALFHRDEDGRWSLTEAGQVLRSDHPDSVATARYSGFEVGGWTRMPETLRSGVPAFELTFGTSFWDWLAQHPGDRTEFDEKMRRRLPAMLSMVADYDWPETGHLVDVGGGTGTLLLDILERRPRMTGTLFDVHETVTTARDRVASSSAAQRCDLVAGSFFDVVPEGGDIYLLSQILHDWPDEAAVRILATVRRAMTAEGSTLLLLEGIFPEVDTIGLGLLDLHMLAMFGAGERDRNQWESLLSSAGFRLEDVVSGGYTSWLRAVPA
ncbi:MAG TPA: methyltransferase [Nocardioides sp.]|uniref:methyltransferase n=1 Tax=Nocardioides sp. TaxID=35761 RepID=UPI002F3EEE3C